MVLAKLCRVLIFSSINLIFVNVGYGKAVPDESQGSYEGPYEYSYSHENEAPGFKYYDLQNYLLRTVSPPHIKNYYSPKINGQPIIVPPVQDLSSDVNKMLNDYYNLQKKVPEYNEKATAQDYKSVHYNNAPAPKDAYPIVYDYKSNEDYEEPVILNVESSTLNSEKDTKSKFDSIQKTQHVSKHYAFKPSIERKNGNLKYKPQTMENKGSFIDYEVKDDMYSNKGEKHGGKNFYVSNIKTDMKGTDKEYDYDVPIIHETINLKSGEGKSRKFEDYDTEMLAKKKPNIDKKVEKLEPPTYMTETEADFDLPLVVKVKKVPGSKKQHKSKRPVMKYADKSKKATKPKIHKSPIDKDLESISKPKNGAPYTNIGVPKIKKDPLDKVEKKVIKCEKSKLSEELDCSKKDSLDESSQQLYTDDSYSKDMLKKTGSEPAESITKGNNLYSSLEMDEVNYKSTEKVKPNGISYPQKNKFSSLSTEHPKEFEDSNVNDEINSPRANAEFGFQSLGSGNSEEDAQSFSLDNKARGFLSSFSPNLWSLVFNPNGKDHKLKRCITRNEESGYCTYIQNCPVPNIATSLEKLLNNACVVDEMFIGVCCPEFPVETIKVHWETVEDNASEKTIDGISHDIEDCGVRSKEASETDSWPWKAPLVSMSNGKIFCGGVVVADEYVLTAAHCTTKIPKNQILVRLGQHDDSSGEDYPVIEIKRHAQYNPRNLHNDIALLKLGRRIVHDEHTGIVCLPEDDSDNDDHDGDKAILLGWQGIFGKNSKKDKPELLKVMSLKECREKMGANVPDTTLCTETRNEDERTCNADSGAPLVVEDDNKYEVIGILSWNRNDCDQRFPSTFSRVSSYLGWIRKHAV